LGKGKSFYEIRLERENIDLKNDNKKLRSDLLSANSLVEVLQDSNNDLNDVFEKYIEACKLIKNVEYVLSSQDEPSQILANLSQLFQKDD